MITLDEQGIPQFSMGVDPGVEYDGTKRFEIPQVGQGPMVIFLPKAHHQGRESMETGRPIHKSVLYIRIQHPGERDTIERQATVEDLRRFPRQYADFRQGRSDDRYKGTPLHVLFPAHPDAVQILEFHRIYCVEALANMGELAIQNIGLGGREWQQKAQRYLEATKAGEGFAYLEDANTKLQDRLKRAESSNQLMEHKLAEQQQQINQLMQQLQAFNMHGSSQVPAFQMPAGVPMPMPMAAPPVPRQQAPTTFEINPDDEMRGPAGFTPPSAGGDQAMNFDLENVNFDLSGPDLAPAPAQQQAVPQTSQPETSVPPSPPRAAAKKGGK